jgi:predicted DsbA family dithiol-disulfide isomerase
MCPWCIVGYKNLLNALTLMENAPELDIHWHPFQLNPAMPKEGQDIREHLAEKYGTTPEQSNENRNRLVQIGQSIGFQFNFVDKMRIYNTFELHRLLHWAKAHGKQTELKLALFEAYFSQGKAMNDLGAVTYVAESVGLDSTAAKEVLQGTEFSNEVIAEEELWKSRGIQAVPAIILAEKYLVSGAQAPETLAQALEQVITELSAA